MIRIIVRTNDAGMAAHVGGDVSTEFKTFDIEAPDVEQFLREIGTYMNRQVVGVELLP